jgi:glycosyltransferase involved in cell wall biosynthesis
MAQAMQLGLPLVVYKTTGTPTFNRKKECVLIAEKGNVEELARHMLTLMDNPEKAESLKFNAREFQEQRMVEARQNGERLMQTFRFIVANEKNSTAVSQELLFNPERDD